MHVASLLLQHARDRRDAQLFVGDGSCNYGELIERALRVAARLRDRTCAGDVIGVQVDDNEDFAALFFGATMTGLSVLPFVRTATDGEIASKLARVHAKLFVSEREVAALGVEHEFARTLVDERDVENPFDINGLMSSDVALMLFTSGTSGVSKVACIDHESLCRHTRSLAHEAFAFDATSRVLATLPLCHSFGLRTTLLVSVAAGASIVLVDRFDAERSLGLAREHGATFLAGVPTMYGDWASAKLDPVPTLQWALSAGASLPASVAEEASRALGAPVYEGYGLTEASFSCIDTPKRALAHGVHGPSRGTCGWPSPGVSLRLHEGEVQVRGPNLMKGYLDDPAATEAAFMIDDEGQRWLRTGDLGLLDGQGRLVVRDRIKDIILRGGRNVVPADVEAALRGAEGVQAAAAVGVEDSRLGEEIAAVLVVDGSFCELSLRQHLEGALDRTLWPRKLAFVTELPLGPSRKVLRRELRERLESGQLETLPFRGRN